MSKPYPVITTVGPEPEVICRELPEAVFDYPFFNEGVTSVGGGERFSLDSWSGEEEESLEISGFIFGVSHCGSTLLSRQLNQLDTVRVVSEPEAINGLLLSKVLYALDDQSVADQLKNIVRMYRQAEGGKRHLVVKLTSWNIFLMPIFRRAFPGVRWIFLDRETESLLASLQRSDGGFIDWWNHPTPLTPRAFLGEGADFADKEAYLRAMVLGHREQARIHQDSTALFLQYPEFLHQFDAILRHLGLAASPDEMARAKATLRYDAKSMKRLPWKG
ncbi:hypothetical protein [Lewinella sp. W8]|uniref:hypothetical protein n=1 Tax=Lewinella sp. W8 TaxID=2528208 RepID=UPI0010674DE6|nr:hypothetical protein [Lewinella sp. W8]MTB50724.1 hypothetical protein [Lewinella sp. W8]